MKLFWILGFILGILLPLVNSQCAGFCGSQCTRNSTFFCGLSANTPCNTKPRTCPGNSNNCGTNGNCICACCWCDEQCLTYGDCCSDYQSVCRRPTVQVISPQLVATAGQVTISLQGVFFGVENTGSKVYMNSLSNQISYLSWTNTLITLSVPAGCGSGHVFYVNNGTVTGDASPSFSYALPGPITLSPTNPPGNTDGLTTTNVAQNITITGTNLCNNPSNGVVRWNGVNVPSANVRSWTNTQIIIALPSGQGKDVPVIVQTASDSSYTVTGKYTYNTPSISTVSPQNLGGGANITLTGFNFGSIVSEVSVTIATFPCVVQTVTHRQLICVLPLWQGTSKQIAITVSQQASTSSVFLYNFAPPTITSLSPSIGPTIGGTSVTIFGTNLGFNASYVSVSFGSNAVCPTNCAITSWNYTQGVFTTTAGPFFATLVSVTVDGQTSNQLSFSWSPPTISGVSPQPAPTAGGTNITFSGNNFGINGSSLATVNGITCPVNYHTHTNVYCTLPAGVGVTTASVISAGITVSTSFQYSPPSVWSISPSNGPCAGNTLVSISGTNFGASGLRIASINGAACNWQTTGGSWSETSILCFTPAGQGLSRVVAVSVASQSSPQVNVTFNYDGPTISSIVCTVPQTTAGGYILTINGNNFGTSGTATVGGLNCTYGSAADWSNTIILCGVPAGQGSGLAVVITVAGGQSATASQTFTYTSPSLTSITPSTGVTSGGVAPFTITLVGTSFGGTTGTVFFGPYSVAPASIISWGHTQIVVYHPPGVGANLVVRVRNSVNVNTTENVLFSYQTPAIDTLNPDTASTGGGVRTMTITGSNFGTLLDSIVQFGANTTWTAATVSSVQATQIICTIPDGQGAISVRVVVGGQISNEKRFSYRAPSLTSITPSSGPTAGNINVTIAGDSLGTTGGSATIGSASCPIVSQTHTQIICTLPAGQGTRLTVGFVVSGFQQTNTPVLFDYNPPTLTSLSTVPTAGGNLTIVGTNFGIYVAGISPAVSFDQTDCPVIFNNHTTIICTAPAGQGSGKTVIVTVGTQPVTGTASYASPSISSIFPTAGLAAGSQNITIQGASFGLAPSVTFNGINCLPIFWNHTYIICSSPSGVGTGISVIVTAGNQVSSSVTWRYSAPSISSTSPSTGNTDGTEILTINGVNFGASGSRAAYIGSSLCPTQSWTDSQITCSVPAGQGTGYLVVVATAGQNSSQNFNFNYTAPVLTGISPPNGPTQGGTRIALTGSFFGLSGNVTVGGQACTVTNPLTDWLHSRIVCTVGVGSGKNRPIQIQVGGQSLSSTGGVTFSYDNPSISSTSPSPLSGVTGGGSGASSLTLIGSSFDTSGNVTLNGVNCTVLTWSQTQITFYHPAGTGTNLPVIVTSVAGFSSSPVFFTYSAPVISSFSPSSAVTGGTVRIMSIGGSSLGTMVATSVRIGTYAATLINVTNSLIFCFIPDGQGVNLGVTVTVSSSAVTASQPFSYLAPTLSTLSPSNGPTTGQISLNLTGTSFGTVGATVVVGSNPCSVFSQDHGFVRCTLPAGQGVNQPVQLTVTTNGVPQVSNSLTFRYDDPVLNSIVPSNGPTSGNINVTLNGANFGTGSASVTIGGTTCSVLSLNHTMIVCNLPAGERILQAVVVSIGTQVSVSSVNFNYDAPVVTNFYSSSPFYTEGAMTLVVEGNNFGTSPSVSIGGVLCTIQTITPHTNISCLVPAGQGSNLALVVRTAVGNQVSPTYSFTYAAPIVNSFTPQNGPTAGGSIITVQGLSFGTSGTVTIGGNVCPVVPGTQLHRSIRCTLPAGNGANQSVVVTVGLRVSNSLFGFNYDGPVITTLQPPNGPTQGRLITVNGANFGSSPAVTVWIGSTQSSCSINLAQDNLITCTLPSGVGSALVSVQSSGQTSTNITFTYDAPRFTSLSPTNGNTEGGYSVTVVGANFGNSSLNASKVYFGTLANPCPVNLALSNHTVLVCTAPAGISQNVAVFVETVGVRTATSGTFSYDGPVITTVTGCPLVKGSGTARCPNDGNVNITVNGFNFGPVGSIFVVELQFQAGPQSLNFTQNNHRQIVATLVVGNGLDLPLQVTLQNARSVTANLISYLAPEIDVASVTLVGSVPLQTGRLSISNSITADQIQFSGSGFGTDQNKVTVIYGLPSDVNTQYPCVVQSATDTQIRCQLSNGVGKNLSLQVTVNNPIVGIQVSEWSDSNLASISYPDPIITPNTIRAGGSTILSNEVVGTQSEGEFITFAGQNLGLISRSSQLRIRYGPAGSAKTYTCSSPSLSANFTANITCLTESGQGGPYVFQVTVLNAISAEGTDTYKYPTPPSVTRVSGCVDSGNRTSGCPTSGGVTVSIYGANFAESAVVRIGISTCTGLKFFNTGFLTCTLPAGAGLSKSIVVSVGALFSPPVSLVDYGLPVISSISGCVDTGNTTIDCPRAGARNLTIIGANLSPRGALVIVNGITAVTTQDSVTPNSKVYVTLPSGRGLNLPVLLIQGDGEGSNVLTISYLRCPAGTHEETNISCTACELGRYQDAVGAPACKVCEAGQFTNTTGRTVCSRCGLGFFSSAIESTSCQPCNAGFSAAATGLTTCAQCGVGEYSASSQSTACLTCAAGRASAATGSIGCQNCTAGSFAPVAGSLSCSFCSPGRFSPTNEATGCTKCFAGQYQVDSGKDKCDCCPVGTAIEVDGQARCRSCDAGFFANATCLETCFRCPAGSFSVPAGGVGATGCTLCPKGQYLADAGQAACLFCPLGRFANSTGSTICLQCAPGKFAGSIGATVCDDCTRGSYSALPEASACTGCQLGRFASTTGLSVCALCNAGYYQDVQGSNDCKACNLGTANPVSGQPRCQACSSGTFSNSNASISCQPCARGKISIQTSDTQGPTDCSDCPAGRFTSATQQSVCVDCPVGSTQDISGQSFCNLCSAGKYAPSPALKNCLDCAPGKFSGLGAFVCNDCPAGYQAPVSTATCTICPAGSIAATASSSNCTDCTAGFYTGTDGQSTCLPCGFGEYSNATALTACYKCSPGFYQDSIGKANCATCPAGRYSEISAQPVCTACPFGQVATTSGLSVCTPCVAGTYSNILGGTQCLPCDIGYFADTAGSITCSACPAGRITSTNSSTTCQPCNAGSYQQNLAQTACVPCERGRSANADGQSQCVACPAGSFGNTTGLQNCYSCPAGTRQPSTGQSFCTACVAGRFASSLNSLACDLCPSGTFSDVGASVCSNCLPGRYQPAVGESTCLNCSAGAAQVSEGQSTCPACTAGTFSDISSATQCQPCPAGTYSTTGAIVCTPCAMGTFASAEGQAACASCPAGTSNNRTGQSACTPCPPGSFQSKGNSLLCDLCTAGRYAILFGSIVCEQCPVGKVSNASASQCTDCPPGFFQPSIEKQVCLTCLPGFYTESSAQPVCIGCPSGRFTNSSFGAQTQCVLCPAGKFQDIVSQTFCNDCPIGKFTSSNGEASCTSCGLGQYNNQTGQIGCVPCEAGRASASIGAVTCNPCAAGYSSAVSGALSCGECAIGTIAPTTGLLACEQCVVGKYQSSTAQITCFSCPPGTYSAGAGQASCPACAPGTYTNTSEAGACISCEPGTFQSAVNSTACTLCPAGTFVAGTGAITCDQCPAGTYGSALGASDCIPCQIGKANSVSGQRACIDCAPGRARSTIGQTFCAPCPAGSYASGTGSINCELCQPGSFSDGVGFSNCTLCPAGKFVSVSGQGGCEDCGVGYHASSPGSFECSPCAAGKYAGITGLAECLDCQKGEYAPVEAMQECLQAPIGQFVNVTGANSTLRCDPGTYQQLLGQEKCQACDVGYFQREFGQSQCIACPIGRWTVTVRTAECVPAYAGTYVPRDGWAFSPLPCQPGYFQPSTGQNECRPCPLGKYMPNETAIVCADCEPGYYQDQANATRCQACPVTTYTGVSGQVDCLACPAGTYGNTTGLSICPTCPGGQINPRVGQLNCSVCPVAQFAISSTECASCPPGRFGRGVGSAQCTACPAGEFQNTTGQTFCFNCTAGRYSGVTEQTECRACPAGTYSNMSSTSICSECRPGFYNPSVGALFCPGCEARTFSRNFGQQRCEECPQGSYNSQTNQSQCTQCPEGRYQTDLGQLDCVDCPMGKYGPSLGLIECFSCPATQYNNGTRKSSCDLCPLGTYQDDSGQSECKPCQAGTYAIKAGQESCPACPAGSFSNSTKATECLPCADGYYADQIGQQNCSACQTGKFSSPDHTLCKLCPPGTFNDKTAQSDCTNCPVNTFNNRTGQVTCEPCANGTFAATGADICSPCPAGSYRTSDLNQCTLCPSGKYSIVGSPVCLLCPLGKFSIDGRPACDDCPAGRYQNLTGQPICEFCPSGRFQNDAGKDVCKLCPLGRATNNLGQVDCSSCEAGTIANVTGLRVCDNCGPGSHQPFSGQSTCLECSVGKYSATNASVDCAPCEPGRFADVTGLSLCLPCPSGKFMSENGAQNCTQCPLGRSSNSTGVTECQLCGKGSFGNITGLISCNKCGLGFYQDILGALDCKSCDPGYFSDLPGLLGCIPCEAGTFNNENQSSFCRPCPSGSIQELPGSTECVACPNGTYADNTTRKACYPCQPGKISYGNVVECADCSLGFFTDQFQATSCQKCPAGKKTSSYSGASSCQDCGNGLVAPIAGMYDCIACTSNALPNSEGTACVCLRGFYDPEDPTRPGICIPCPVGADCRRLGTTWRTMVNLPNWWRSSNATTTFYRCEFGSQCKVGSAASCAPHRGGPICAICDPGYFSFFGGQCEVCPKRGGLVVYMIFITIVAVLAYLGLNTFLLYSARDLMKQEKNRQILKASSFDIANRELDQAVDASLVDDKSQQKREIASPSGAQRAVKFIRSEADIPTLLSQWRPAYVPVDEQGKVLQVVDGRVQYPTTLTYKLKILISFFQIITNIGVGLELPWPSGFKSFVSFFSVLNFDLMQAANLDCLFDRGTVYYNKVVFMAAAPWVLLGAIIVFYTLPKYIQSRAVNPSERGPVVRRIYYKTIKLLLFTLFLIYPTVSSTALRTFNCKRIDDQDYLIADFNTYCYTPQWRYYSVIAAIFGTIFAAGIPLFFFLLTFRARQRLYEPGTKAALGILYNGYANSAWWFEMVDMLHKLILCCILPFLPSDAQLQFALVLVALYLLVILLMKPYKSDGDDMMHVAVQCLLWLFIYSGMLLRSRQIESATDAVLSVVMIVLTVLMVAWGAKTVLYYVYEKAIQWWNARKEDERDLEAFEKEQALEEQKKLYMDQED